MYLNIIIEYNKNIIIRGQQVRWWTEKQMWWDPTVINKRASKSGQIPYQSPKTHPPLPPSILCSLSLSLTLSTPNSSLILSFTSATSHLFFFFFYIYIYRVIIIYIVLYINQTSRLENFPRIRNQESRIQSLRLQYLNL